MQPASISVPCSAQAAVPGGVQAAPGAVQRATLRCGVRRVALTGLGIVSPLGLGKEVFWENLQAGRSAAARVEAFDASGLKSTVAAEVRDFDVADLLGPAVAAERTQQTDRANQFMLVAAQQAMADACLDMEAQDRSRVGVCIGSAVGDQGARTRLVDELFECFARGDEAALRQQAALALNTFLARLARNVASWLGAQGECVVLSTACASSTDALGYAFRQVQQGEADVMIAGGTEAPVWPIVFYSHSLLNTLSQHNEEPERASRPFDRTRNGFVIGEGAGAVVLEDWGHARRRGARIYAEVAGFSMTADGYHMTAPCPATEQAARAIQLALSEAGLQPQEVDYFCAHGTGTPLNDVNETKTIKSIFGSAAYRLPISAIKSMLGHPQGASGIMQAVACALVLQHGFVPPTINYREPDPECDLDYVPNVGRAIPVRTIVQNTASFFGRNCVVIYKKEVA